MSSHRLQSVSDFLDDLFQFYQYRGISTIIFNKSLVALREKLCEKHAGNPDFLGFLSTNSHKYSRSKSPKELCEPEIIGIFEDLLVVFDAGHQMLSEMPF